MNNVRRGQQVPSERRKPMDEKKREALQELLKILSDTPELADKVVITIKPNSKPKQ